MPSVDLSSPSTPYNVVLAVGGRKLYVSKEYLAVHSPVFEAMFFGEFAEKGKEEVEIKDVAYEEFIDLLHLIYNRGDSVNDGNAEHILKLADRFQMERALDECATFLVNRSRLPFFARLLMADQYNLDTAVGVMVRGASTRSLRNLHHTGTFASLRSQTMVLVYGATVDYQEKYQP